ncbi:hypothetical protein A2U01_0113513, partial [Trifolium medium]|nr:hypothetical protein [Trifolium medium]
HTGGEPLALYFPPKVFLMHRQYDICTFCVRSLRYLADQS